LIELLFTVPTSVLWSRRGTVSKTGGILVQERNNVKNWQYLGPGEEQYKKLAVSWSRRGTM
jgi:hypothetical protein